MAVRRTDVRGRRGRVKRKRTLMRRRVVERSRTLGTFGIWREMMMSVLREG